MSIVCAYADAQHGLDLSLERLELIVYVRLALRRAATPSPCFQADQGDSHAEQKALSERVGAGLDGSGPSIPVEPSTTAL